MGILQEIEADQIEAAAVSIELLQTTARELFAPQNLNLAAVGPWKAAGKKGVQKILDRYQKDFPAAG
jgi:hypothetical protein